MTGLSGPFEIIIGKARKNPFALHFMQHDGGGNGGRGGVTGTAVQTTAGTEQGGKQTRQTVLRPASSSLMSTIPPAGCTCDSYWSILFRLVGESALCMFQEEHELKMVMPSVYTKWIKTLSNTLPPLQLIMFLPNKP